MILCCGEALIDMLPRRTAAGEAAFAPYPGGSVFNSAVALGRLGATVGFFSGLSTDLFGQRLREALREAGVDSSLAVSSARPTTLAFVSLEDGQASYVFYDEQSAARMVGEADLPKIGADVSALLFGGISLISEPCGNAYEMLARREHRDRVIMLDPNIRPDFIVDRAAHETRIRRMIAVADIVKVSEDDLAWFGASGRREFADWCLSAGAGIVLVTAGGKGVAAFTAEFDMEVAAAAASVVDTVGAGDTFNAGFLAALDDQGRLDKASLAAVEPAALRQALDFAARTAAVTVSRAGANPPWRHEVPPPGAIPA